MLPIELSGVDVTLGRTPILSDVSMVLGAGEVVGVRGPNGSGKTTLLRLLATLLPVSAGSARVLGTDLADWRNLPDLRRRVGFISHEPALYPELSLAENLDLAVRLLGLDPSGTATMLRKVGLEGAAARRAVDTSFGMRRRVEFARLLLQGPSLILLDEAHAGLDADAHILVEETVRRVREIGGAAVLVSHESERVEPLVDRMFQLREGTLVEDRP